MGYVMEYDFKYKNGHVEVYDHNGKFLFSADTVPEAKRELEQMGRTDVAA